MPDGSRLCKFVDNYRPPAATNRENVKKVPRTWCFAKRTISNKNHEIVISSIAMTTCSRTTLETWWVGLPPRSSANMRITRITRLLTAPVFSSAYVCKNRCGRHNNNITSDVTTTHSSSKERAVPLRIVPNAYAATCNPVSIIRTASQ